MTLDDITPPSNFLALKAIFRSMLPPEWTQRDGYPSNIEITSGGEYVEITSGAIHRQEGEVDEGSDTESAAVLAWWSNFVSYAKEFGGREIVWRIRPEFDSHVYPEIDFVTGETHPRAGQRVYRVYARLYIPKVYRCPLCVPGSTFASQAELDDHLALTQQDPPLPSGDVMAESP